MIELILSEAACRATERQCRETKVRGRYKEKYGG